MPDNYNSSYTGPQIDNALAKALTAIQLPQNPTTGQFLCWNGTAWVAGGFPPDFIAALLQLAEKVAYIDDGGQTYYSDLFDALYHSEPAELVSISAEFTQGLNVIYDTDSLDTLKQYLVVTATYSDSTTATVPGTDYTLSGTLTEGTSTITVSYGGKTTTFNVTVTEYVDTRTLLYNWDLTDSLTDTKQSKVAALANGTQDSSGVHLTGPNHRIVFGSVLTAGRNTTVEVDLTEYVRQGTDHGRFIMVSGTTGFIYRKTGIWALYLNGSWTESVIADSTYFNGKTISMKFVWSGTSSVTVSVWCDGAKIVEATEISLYNDISLGSAQSSTAYNSTFTALRVYEGV